MSDPGATRPSLWKLGADVHAGVMAGDASAVAVAARGKRIIKVIFWLFVVNLVGSCAMMIARPEKDLPPVEATITRDGDKAVAIAAMPLDPDMSPVQLSYSETIAGQDEYESSMVVTDPEGRQIYTSRGRSGGTSSGGWTWPLVKFDVRHAGPHEVRFELRGQPERLQRFTVHGRTHMSGGYFLGITILLGVGAWGAQRWWRRTVAEPWWNAQHPDKGLAEPVPVERPAAVPQVSAPVATSAETGSVFSEPFAGRPAPPSLVFRLGARLFLWFVSLGISMLWLPIAGCYLLFALLGVFVVIGGVAVAGGGGMINAVMAAPETEKVFHYLAGKFSGLSGLELLSYLGTIAFAVLLPFHIVLVVVRAIAHRGKDPAPPSFAARFKLLLRWNVFIYAGLLLISLWSSGFHAFLDSLVGALLLVGMVFVPATIVLYVTTRMESVIDSGHKALE